MATTVERLKARLADAEALERSRRLVRESLQLSSEVVRAEGERQAAPLVTRDAVLALLAEQRKASQWARWACWAALASVGLGVAALFLH